MSPFRGSVHAMHGAPAYPPSPDVPRLTPVPRVPSCPSWTARAYGASHAGFVRKHNEDHFLIANVTSAIQVVQANLCAEDVYYGPSPMGLYMVADGMGGHAAGERAAALALTAMERFILATLSRSGTSPAINPAELLCAGFQSADEAVFEESTERTSLSGMGTTMTAALVAGPDIHICHAGDSRAYLLRERTLTALTTDHTFANELRVAGLIRQGSVAYREMKHIVTNVIGGGTPGVCPEIKKVEAMAGDRLILCSDGLTDMVPDDRLREVLVSAPTPEMATYRLIEAALDAGGRDNVTVVVIDLAVKN